MATRVAMGGLVPSCVSVGLLAGNTEVLASGLNLIIFNDFIRLFSVLIILILHNFK